MYIVMVIMSMQLFHRWDIQNGGEGIDQEIQILGKESHQFGPLDTSRGPHVTVSGGENLVGTPGETTCGRGPESYYSPIPT